MELRYKTTDLVIFLDINRFLCLASVLKRNGKKRSDIPEYLEEKMDKDFFRLCKGLWIFSKTRRRTIMNLHRKYPEAPFLVIKSRRKVNRLLRQWRDERAR
jgi:adenylate kinase family enzyme